MATIIDGSKLSEEIREELKEEISVLKGEGITPGLTVVLVGENPASQVYVKNKEKACEKVGIESFKYTYAEDLTEDELLNKLDQLNQDERVDGILVQLPLPEHINEKKVIEKIIPEKDVDGFHPINVGNLFIGEPLYSPCTPSGIMEMLKRYDIPLEGKQAVIIGRSNIVGKPVAMMLMKENCTIEICHSRTQDLAGHSRRADILVAAVGRSELVKGDWVKEGAVVIDVGVNRVDDKLVGDVAFDEAKERASAITPVPGGVGPMTITMLLKNTVKSAKLRAGKI